MPPLRSAAAALALCLSTASAASSSGLAASMTCGGARGPTYSISLDGAVLFHTPPPLAVFVDGAWATTWVLAGSRDVEGTDELGAYAGTECAYALASAPRVVFFTAASYTYAAPAAAPRASAVRFAYSLPSGAARTNHSAGGGAAYSTVANFPAFSGGGAPLLPGVLTWRDAFFGPSYALRDAFGQIASVAVLFDPTDAGARAVMLSPLDTFLNAALGDDMGGDAACAPDAGSGCWAGGASATLTSVPPGFAASFVLVADSGVTATVDSWGAVLRSAAGATPSGGIADLSMSTLGYTTDNGAQLCFGCPGQVLDKCLLEEKAYLDSIHIPLGYLSFQNDWWTSADESAPWCVGEWVPETHKVPMGMQAFQAALDLPLQLYAPYFCKSSAYPLNYSMIRSDTTLPGCKDMDFFDAAPEDAVRFYEFLFTLGQDYGMTMYEPDFLNANHVCVPRFIEEVGAADMFFSAQTGVALAKGIPIQWCFCTPMLLLWTLKAPAVTNFRVSYDFFYGGSWDTGVSSLIVWAAGKGPSKDTFWTSDNGNQSTTRGACDKKGCPPDHSTPAAVLHTMLAVLSAGPVQFSDAPGETDAVLIMRTCDAGATLLQPSKPLTAVDSTHSGSGAGVPGYALATYTAVGGSVWLHQLLTHQLAKPYTARALDLYPRLAAGATYATTSWAALQACAATAGGACGVTTLQGPADARGALLTLPAVAPGTDKFTPTLTLIVPLTPSGVALFGEADKFATLSVQRFVALTAMPAGVDATLVGVPGETIRVAWWAKTRVVFANATFAAAADGAARTTLACSFAADGTGACK